MVQSSQLNALLTQAVAGTDSQAKERAYAEVLRLLTIFVRGAMGSALRRRRESVDICQSVAKSLVADVQRGVVEFPSEAALVAYLQMVVRSKLAEVARYEGALKRGGGTGPGFDLESVPSSDPSASADSRGRDAGMQAAALIDERGQELIRLRQSGLSWEQISELTGRSPAALRQEWSRLQAKVRDGFA